ncbi:DUF1775 domain-containing protein [Streptomyces sp. NPDC088254]|uniref:DUF1775 domain-containing protein n=1 Tax=Streptomyces sp. NPDC088254 TaxID=3365847 RepID=UPI00382A866D
MQSLHPSAREFGRFAVSGALALTSAFVLARPASAHAGVEADAPRALARNVTLTFTSEAESDTAGFTRVRVVLPKGIEPGEVTLAHAPKGWTLKITSDGYTIGGPALATGEDAEHAITVRRLPDVQELVFKTIDTYGDGRISRWLELPTQEAKSDQPAPVLRLKPATADAQPLDPPSARVSRTLSEGPSDGGDAHASARTEAEKPAGGLIAAGTAAALLGLGAFAWRLNRRRAGRGGAR